MAAWRDAQATIGSRAKMTSLSHTTASLFVAFGGGIGAVMRYHLGRAVTAWVGIPPMGGFPWPTLAANTLGGLAMGVLVGCLARGLGGEFEQHARLMLGVGLLGGFTTFSSFSLETWLLIEDGRLGIALVYILASVVASIFALVCGLTLTRVF
tara:strand:- start:16 stop:474 length:459 start_codon:yes stop_codon:yes gene_type:complete